MNQCNFYVIPTNFYALVPFPFEYSYLLSDKLFILISKQVFFFFFYFLFYYFVAFKLWCHAKFVSLGPKLLYLKFEGGKFRAVRRMNYLILPTVSSVVSCAVSGWVNCLEEEARPLPLPHIKSGLNFALNHGLLF